MITAIIILIALFIVFYILKVYLVTYRGIDFLGDLTSTAEIPSISQRPGFPAVTPAITVDGIMIGASTYYETTSPEAMISVISVSDAYAYVMEESGELRYILLEEFLLKYTQRTQTSISKHD